MIQTRELFSTELYKKAFAFALKAHKGQTTPEGLEYSFHIVSVALEVINSLTHYTMSCDDANIAICCALLHDVNEDTKINVTNSLDVDNVDVVVAGVQALTKDESLETKHEQMSDSLKRLKKQPKCVQMVKLADRITNLAPAPDFWNRAKRESYLEEAKMIHKELKDTNPYLADKLQKKIECYEVEKGDEFLAFFNDEVELVLDKNYLRYLKTFKALNRLNSYVQKEYSINLFESYLHININDKVSKKRVGMSYIVKVLGEKNLLNLNRQIDEKIQNYMSTIFDAEEGIVL